MKDILKKAIKKKMGIISTEDAKPKDEISAELVESMTKGLMPLKDDEYETQSREMIKSRLQKPVTLDAPGDAMLEEEDSDIAPGKPAEPEDESAEAAEGDGEGMEALLEALMGGDSEDEIKGLSKKPLKLSDRIKIQALKMKKA